MGVIKTRRCPMTTLLQINSSIFSGRRPIEPARRRIRRGMARKPSRERSDRPRSRERRRPAPRCRAFWRLHRQARRAHRGAARHRRFSDALIDELQARRRHRARPADVQLRRAVDVEGVLRSHRARGCHFPVHGKGPVGLLDGKEGLRVRDARRSLCRHAARHADRLRARLPALHRHRPMWNSSMPKG